MAGSGPGRTVGFVSALVCAAVFLLGLTLQPALGADPDRYVHEGVASCAGSSCHGRLAPSGPVVRQNELFTWQLESSPAGEHSRTWKILLEPRAREIAERLDIGPAEQAPECLGCHADPVAPNLRGRRFQISDGVGCETCHGGSREWVAGHYVVGANHLDNVSRGLRQLENPRVQANLCLDCHYGSDNPGQFVTHEIMAAGHPRLSFELDLFTNLQAHHTVDADYLKRKRVTSSVQVWAVGQALALERALNLYSDPQIATNGVFPELYFFDCHSCHRRISDSRDARPGALPNPGRLVALGTPVFNDENIIMLSAVAWVVAPELGARFEIQSRDFHQALALDRSTAVEAAQTLSATASDMADAFVNRGMNRDETFTVLENILDGALNRYTDYAGSAQAVMATDTLLSSMAASGQVRSASVRAIRPDLERAYAAVYDPNTYDPTAFRAEFRRVAEAVRRLR